MIIPKKLVYYTTLLADMAMHNAITRPWWTKITDKIILGAMPFRDRDHIKKLKELGVTGVITLNRMYELQPNLIGTPIMPHQWFDKGIDICYKPVDDYDAPTFFDLTDCMNFIDKHETVYIHCKAGKGRSAIVVMNYLMTRHEMTITQAHEFVKSKRSYISPNAKQLASISTFSHNQCK
jgi:atypical dual specificity phosphatase